MENIKIIADNKIPYLKGILEPFAQMEYLSPQDITKDVVKDANALIIRTRTVCDESLLRGSKVKMIATATIGFDHIDRDYCALANIQWSNCPGCNADSVAQYIMSTIFLWCQKHNRTMKGLRLGIVGVGNVGSKVEAFAHRLGIETLLCDPPRALDEDGDHFLNIEDIAEKADILTFHTPLTFNTSFATYKLCNSEILDRMIGRDVLIINSARGGVVDEKALLDFMAVHPKCEAVIDCWENEPDINTELLYKAMISTPHIAGYSYDGKSNATKMAVENIADFFNFSIDTSVIQPPAPENPDIIIADIVGKMVEDNIIEGFVKDDISKALVNVKSIDDILKIDSLPIETKEYIVGQVLLHTYDPRNDSDRLLNDPGSFEYQRGDYPFRRELKAYTIKYW